MRVVIAGGHGRIALILERLLSTRGDSVAGLIRDPDQARSLAVAGAEALVVDLESASAEDVAKHLDGADAVVFAAGAGAGSAAARKESVDRDAAILLADAAEAAGVRRYLLISAMGADLRARDDAPDPVFRAYLRAKAAAEEAVRARTALAVTVVRPGLLMDAEATGRVTLADVTDAGGITREDVAAVLVALLDVPGSEGRTLEVIAGGTLIADAVRALAPR
ncbi:NAD(P)H-binding protein [Streptomyces sp. NPDC002680]|uniref:NAD(P)H-binding protein n=1 Tax=Streptomyces sp. NPDC002680 TaxID=3364659 RepID=UPI0036C8B790